MRSIEVLAVDRPSVGGFGSMAAAGDQLRHLHLPAEVLQTFAEYQFIVYGLILTFALLVLPRGLASVFFEAPRYIRAGALKAARSGNAPTAPAAPAAPEPPDRATITVETLSKSFGGLVALDGVSLTLEPGHITALVGPNGSGKSTLVNVVTGIYKPSGGRVLLGDRDITGMAGSTPAARTGHHPHVQDPRRRCRRFHGGGENRRRGLPQASLRRSGSEATLFTFLRHAGSAVVGRAGVERVMEETGHRPLADTPSDRLPYGYCASSEVVSRLLAKASQQILSRRAAAGTSRWRIAGPLGVSIRGDEKDSGPTRSSSIATTGMDVRRRARWTALSSSALASDAG